MDSYFKLHETSPEHLPPCPEGFTAGGNLQAAFRVCKSLELEQQWTLSGDDPGFERILLDLSPTCAARVLGFSLLHPPSDAGQDNLAAEILACDNDRERLARLAHLYVFGFIAICT